MKHPTFILLASSLFLAASAAAAVPHRWTVETSRISPEQIEAYRGETLALEATLNAYGKPLETALESPVCLYWQTNGMDAVYWVTNAEVKTSIGEVRGDLAPSPCLTNTVLSASFLPSFAPAASAVQGFIGSPASSYRASFVIRFRNAPGETPNVLPLPAQAIDFNTITVYNPPYYTKAEVDTKIANAAPADYANVSNKAVNAASAAALSAHASATSNPHAVTAKQTGVEMTTAHKTLYNGVGDSRLKVFDDEASATVKVGGREATLYTTAYADYLINQKASAKTVSTLSSDVETLKTTVSSNTSAINNRPTTTTLNAYSNELATAISNATPSDYATVKANASSALSTANANKTSISAINSAGYITQTKADAAYYPKASGDAWSSYWDGDDVRVTVTNYDSAVHMPTLYLEQRTNDTASASDDEAFRVVWKEMTHWDAFLGSTWNWEDATWQGFDEWRTSLSSALDEKADRAWGFYDSHTGEYAPDGYTSISSSNVMICAGASYQKTATATCDVWVLTANEPYEPTGVSTNGGFQIKDADGNVQFEIVKGDKRTVKAQANRVCTTNSTLYVVYNVVAAEAPTGEVCFDLNNPDWKEQGASDCPAAIAWSGSSGAWTAAITPTDASADHIFFKASYMTGGDDYINNRAPVGMSQLVLDGTTYTLGTATIDGHTVLTLTPAK